MRKFHLVLTIAAMTTAAAFAHAAELDVPPPAAPKELPVQVNQPNCTRWTDDCVNCTRGANGAAPICSNIGIACQPKAIRCVDAETPKSEPAKKE